MSGVGIDIAAGAGAAPIGSREPLRVAAVGVSTSRTCGVRDHAVLLAEALARENVSCSLHWLWRTGRSMRAANAEVRGWTRALGRELDPERLDAVLLHYSVFEYSYRGVPLFVHPALSTLRNLGVPVVTVLHEYAYPWRRGGVRGKAWALSQRALLVEVMSASAAVVVTAAFRGDWLATRRWLPQRRVAVAPVFSNLPPSVVEPRPGGAVPVVGLFGYSHEGASVAVVLDALRLLDDRGVAVRLMLLGAPGSPSAVAAAWQEGARTRGIAQPLEFSGILAPQELSDALAACDVLLCADRPGPTSRKTTLAASLASGRAVVAIDGRNSWQELIASQAALVIPPTGDALADALERVLGDDDLRQTMGARGSAFAQRRMSVEGTAVVVARLLEDVLSES